MSTVHVNTGITLLVNMGPTVFVDTVQTISWEGIEVGSMKSP